MKTAALELFRRKLAADQPVFGLWVTLESASITEMAVAQALDWVVIDAEHGHLDWKEILEHIRAAVRSDTVVLVRVAELNVGLIKRALDIGADGVVIPWIESSEQLRQAVSFCRYPPQGVRGIGAERATAWGQCFAEHTAEANENVLVVPIIETVRGGRSLQTMLDIDGVEVFFLGPADYSATAGHRGQWEGPGVAEQLLQIKEAVRRAGKYCGVMTTSIANLRERREQGFSMLGLGTDAGLLLRSLHDALGSAGRDCKMTTGLDECRPVRESNTAAAPLKRPPESMRPDRAELIVAVGSGPKIEIANGVNFECLVGKHCQAQRLTTGIVTFNPRAELPYHTHTFAESVTLLKGEAEICIEGRRYELEPLDNVTLPRGIAHQVRNLSQRHPALFHIAMATDNPTRTLIEKMFPRKQMPDNSTGMSGSERVTRFRTAKRFAAGPNTQFIDYFNSDLMPNLEMSGGYGLFAPGGRLPAHVHDFDESICIIEGVATCIVEGRKYQMQDSATAMQPRGRVHYFINQSNAPMAMIWVYAGPLPERIVVDESNATLEGSPWK
jgi:2-keto-3-deoxy-L-rhamnonate aldolase RhmA/quercetin dioxygenase-like cupin family protein